MKKTSVFSTYLVFAIVIATASCKKGTDAPATNYVTTIEARIVGTDGDVNLYTIYATTTAPRDVIKGLTWNYMKSDKQISGPDFVSLSNNLMRDTTVQKGETDLIRNQYDGPLRVKGAVNITNWTASYKR